MPDDYLRSIEPLDRDRLRWAYAVAPPRPNPTALSLPSSGVSSLDLGRLWQRRRPFFFVYAVTFAAILRRHRFSNPQHGRRACSCHIGKQRENHMAKTNYQVTFNGKVVDIRKRDRIYNRTGQRLDLLGGQCPRWVKLRSSGGQPAGRLYPQLRTWPCTAQLTLCANTGSRSSSVNDLVGAQQDCFGDGHSEAFRDLEVHDQLEPRRALDGEVYRLNAAQYPANVDAATAKHIWKVRS